MSCTRLIICLYFFLMVVFKCTCGQTYENTTALRSDLFAGYDTEVRPLTNQSQPLDLEISLFLYNIIKIDSVDGIATTVAGIMQAWNDEKLTWTPSNYGNISFLSILQSSIWTPDITPANAIEFDVLDKPWMRALVFSNGLTLYQPGGVLKTSCTFNMKFWPFDKQVCDIILFAAGYVSPGVKIRLGQYGFNVDNLLPNAEWTLEDVSTYETEGKMAFRMKLKRQSTFYVLTVIIPLVALALLNPYVYFLPADSGERLSYSITILLAMTVFLTVISDLMPKTSASLATIFILITISLASSVLCTLSVILNLAIYHRNDAVYISSIYRSLVQVASPARCCKTQVSDIAEKQDDKKTNGSDDGKNAVKIFVHETHTAKSVANKLQLTEFIRNSNAVEEGHEMGSLNRTSELTWKDVSYAIDKVLFFTLTLCLVIPTVTVLVYLPVTSDYIE